MSKLHIVRLAEEFPPAQGGLAPGMLALSLEQHRRGHRVTVITRDVEASRSTDDKLPFQVIRVSSRSLIQFGWKAYAVLRGLPDGPDIVHCHGPAAAPILFQKRKGDPPVVLTLHAVRNYQYRVLRNLDQLVASFVRFTGSPVRNLPRLYRPWSPHVVRELFLERYMCQRADYLALVAEYFRQQVADYYRVPHDKCTVTYNGSEFSRRSSGDPKKAKASLGFNQDDRIILYVGRFDWQKRIHLLVQAMPAVLQFEKRARLLLVGDGDQRADLEFLIARMGLEDRVSLQGWIQHERLQDVYGCVDCLCLPSICEGLSKVILEAISMHVPVVASDIPGNREVLQDGKAGSLIERPDPLCCASVLGAVLTNHEEANERAQRAAKLLEERYRWPHVANRLDGVYRKLNERR